MLNYWWVSRPKRKLDSIPEVLAAFADLSLGQQWSGQRDVHIAYEDALEEAGLKRVGDRRDHAGSGGRTYKAWIESLGLVFERNKKIYLTLAGEAIMAGDSPVEILTQQVLKYQFPSAFSVSRGVQVNERFRIRPFRFLLKLLSDPRVGYLTQSEIARICAVDAENETTRCYEEIVNKIIRYRSDGDRCLDPDFFVKYKPSKGTVNPDHPYSHLEDMANTMINWLEYTQLARRNDDKQLVILDDKKEEVQAILSTTPSFIARPEEHEYFQRKYGLDPRHQRDNRNLDQTQTITARIIAENKVRQAYIRLSLTRPITQISNDLILEIASETGIINTLVEDTLLRHYPHGSIGSFMSSYFEMAFNGRDDAVDFEKATTELFKDVFGYETIHLGQTGAISAPDVLLLSDAEGYQAIVDNKAYSRYSITGDHHNRMVHNYLEHINNYSNCDYPIGFFTYIAGGFVDQIDRQIHAEVEESGVPGSGITVSNFIKMIEKQTSGEREYSHESLRNIFGLNRQIRLADL